VRSLKNLLGNDFTIRERKSSKFGSVGTTDQQSGLLKLASPKSGQMIDYYDDDKRKEAYKSYLDRYMYDQLARPIIDLITHATFSKDPDFQGSDELVNRAKQIVRDSQIDWLVWGRDLEVHGDLFIRAFLGRNGSAKLASIPPDSIDIDYDQDNVLNIKSYIQGLHSGKDKKINPKLMSHIKIHCTTNTVYGASTLRNVLWWFDVLDLLWERNWIRGSNYYGAPIIAITGIPPEHIAALKAALEGEGQRPGKNWLLPPDCKVEVPDLTKGYPMDQLIDRVYQYILAACGIPQHMIYESDSSRGVAMFSADSFEMMIKGRRRTLEKGLVRAFRIIFEEEGLVKPEDDMDFRIGWAPVFMRDLEKLGKMVATGMENGLLSRKTGRELLGVDHSQELERLEKQDEEEPKPETDPLSKQMADRQATSDALDKTLAAKPPPAKSGSGGNKRVQSKV